VKHNYPSQQRAPVCRDHDPSVICFADAVK
jgi:hypothetical protein